MTSRPTPCAAPSRRRVLSLAGLGVLGLALTGCAEEDSLAQQANSGDQKGYIAGDGTVSEYPSGERGEPVQFTGTLFDGTELSAEDLRGRPALLNFWYAGCAPCRVEAPDLKELAQRFDGQAAFYGVNLRDVPPQAVPTTLVLDAEGRVAARILGIADRSVLETLLEDTVAEAA